MGILRSLIKKKKTQKKFFEQLNHICSVMNNIYWANIALRREAILSKLPEQRLEHFEYAVYSQNGEDGILAEIFNRIGTKTKKFVEFGVEDGRENNSVYLLSQGWQGLWIEALENNCAKIEHYFSSYLTEGSLKLERNFARPDNINNLISKYFTGEIDLLSVDIDGYDYDVLQAMTCIKPRVIVCEYNATFPPPCKWHMPYSKEYFWTGDNYFGMSLSSASELARKKGYVLVGTELNGSNAFFIRQDLFEVNKEKFSYPLGENNLYNPPRYGQLPYFRGHPNSNRYPRCMRGSDTPCED